MTFKPQTKTQRNSETSNVLNVSYTIYVIEGEGDKETAKRIGFAMTDGTFHKLYASFKNQVILRKPEQPLEGVSYLVNQINGEGSEVQIGLAAEHKDKGGHDVFGLPKKVVLRTLKPKK